MFRPENQITVNSESHFREIIRTGNWNPYNLDDRELIFTNHRADLKPHITLTPIFWFRYPKEYFIELCEEYKTTNLTTLIFHVSRCGSTLLSNLLDAPANQMCLNEPHLFNNLIQHQDIQLEIYSRRLANANCNLIVKTSSWNIAKQEWLLELFPTARVIYVYRDPLEVLASFESEINGWINYESILRLFNDESIINESDSLIRFARCLLYFLKKIQSTDAIKIEYNQIKEEVLYGSLPNIIKYDMTTDLEQQMNLILSMNSKKKNENFVSDSELKQKRAINISSKLPPHLLDELIQSYIDLKMFKELS